MNPRWQFTIKELRRQQHLLDKLAAHAQGGSAGPVEIASSAVTVQR